MLDPLYMLYMLTVDIPAPILYGKLYDSLCIVWNYSCGERTNCAVYDSKGKIVFSFIVLDTVKH